MRFAAFYQNPVNHGQADLSPIEATGDRSVIILDARENLDSQHALCVRECKARGYVGFTINRGDSFTRNVQTLRPLHLIKA